MRPEGKRVSIGRLHRIQWLVGESGGGGGGGSGPSRVRGYIGAQRRGSGCSQLWPCLAAGLRTSRSAWWPHSATGLGTSCSAVATPGRGATVACGEGGGRGVGQQRRPHPPVVCMLLLPFSAARILQVFFCRFDKMFIPEVHLLLPCRCLFRVTFAELSHL